MRSIVSVLILMSSLQAVASSDSVAVMLRPEKTVVLINEFKTSRVHAWMDLMGVGSELHLLNQDQSIKVDCGRQEKTASCTFRFLPSHAVKFDTGLVEAVMPLENAAPGDLEISFESSRGDRFVIVQSEGQIYFRGSKARH